MIYNFRSSTFGDFDGEIVKFSTSFFAPLGSQLQFFTVTAHTAYNLYDDCDFPDSMNVVVLAYSLSLIVLFSNFYYRSYVAKKRGKDAWGRHSFKKYVEYVKKKQKNFCNEYLFFLNVLNGAALSYVVDMLAECKPKK